MFENPVPVEVEEISKSYTDKRGVKTNDYKEINIYTIENGTKSLLYSILSDGKPITSKGIKVKYKNHTKYYYMFAETADELKEKLIREFKRGTEYPLPTSPFWVRNCKHRWITYGKAKQILNFGIKKCGLQVPSSDPSCLPQGYYVIDNRFTLCVSMRDFMRNRYFVTTFDNDVVYWLDKVFNLD